MKYKYYLLGFLHASIMTTLICLTAFVHIGFLPVTALFGAFTLVFWLYNLLLDWN